MSKKEPVSLIHVPTNILHYIPNMLPLTDYLEFPLGLVVQKPINTNPGLKVDQNIKFYFINFKIKMFSVLMFCVVRDHSNSKQKAKKM